MKHEIGEPAVIVMSKRLCGCVLTVTDKSPKMLRFTLVNRLRNYSLDIVENLCEANLARVRARRGSVGRSVQSYMAHLDQKRGSAAWRPSGA